MNYPTMERMSPTPPAAEDARHLPASDLLPGPCSLPGLDSLLARTHVVSIPLHTEFRGVREREAVLIEGTEAWAEFSPFLEYGAAEAAHWLAAALEFGFDPELHRFESGTVAVNATIPAVSADAVASLAARYRGCGTVKIKVAERGQQLHDDVERVIAVREAFGDVAIRVDANGGWSVDEAERALRAFAAEGIQLQYAEQPVATVPELADLRRRVADLGVRIAADESIRKADDPLAVARTSAADHAVVKVQPLGGVRRAAEVVARSGLTATVSSALETSVGLSMGAQLAARLAEGQQSPFAAGLGTLALFAADVCNDPRLPVNGAIPVAPAVPDASRLRDLAASGARRDWWIERIRECYAMLAS